VSHRKEFARFAPALALLLIAVLINYADRGTLALAAPLIKAEWGISATQLGILFSAFFWTYMSLQFGVGWLVDRFSVNAVMALGFLVWSLSMAGSGLSIGFASLLAMRLLLGVGESVMFPAASKLCAQHLPEYSRGLANAMLMAAIRWGSAVGTFGGGLFMAHYGWRHTFLYIGLASLLWLPAWRRWKPSPPAIPAMHREPSPGFSAILRQPSFWGAATGHCCGNYLLYFLISWLPYYLVHERHLSMTSMAGAAGVLYAIDSLSAIVAGAIADEKVRQGGNPAAVRKWTMTVGFAISALGLIACAFAGSQTYWWCFLAIGIGSGTGNSASFAVGQTLAGPRVAGKWVGLQNGFANLSGIIGPPITGLFIDRTGHFAAALALTALISVVGGLAWAFGVPDRQQVDWTPPEKALVER
jgi:MFS family permease